MSEPQKYYGKYRGTVINNVDPEMRGRILVEMATSGTLPSITSWALPCLPVGGPQMGIFTVPPIGASVWIEFEQGNIDYPIWVGSFWEFESAPAEVPALARVVPPGVPGITLQTMLQNGIVISDMPPTPATGGIMLKSMTGATLVVNDAGIFLQNGKGASLTMVGPVVDINMGALTIT